MKQLQYQYKTRHYNLHQAYLNKEGRPDDVSPDDWNWLVNNKWSDSKFQVKLLEYLEFKYIFCNSFILDIKYLLFLCRKRA